MIVLRTGNNVCICSGGSREKAVTMSDVAFSGVAPGPDAGWVGAAGTVTPAEGNDASCRRALESDSVGRSSGDS